MNNNKKNIVRYIVLVPIAIVFILPLIIVLLNTFKTNGEIIVNALALPNKNIGFKNYLDAIKHMNYARSFFNSLFITCFSILGMIIIGSMAAYKLSRTKSGISTVLFLIVIIPFVIPLQTNMITLTQVVNFLNLNNSLNGLVLIYWGTGTSFVLLNYHGYIKTIPRELDDSAQIDGLSSFQFYRHILLPLLQPVTATVVIIEAIWIWNDFIIPLLFVNSSRLTRTLQLTAFSFYGTYSTQWNLALTALILVITPVTILFIFLQRYIVSGITSGAIKG